MTTQTVKRLMLCTVACAVAGCAEKREPPPPLDLDRTVRQVTGDGQPVATGLNTGAGKAGERTRPGAGDTPLSVTADGGKALPANLWQDVPVHAGARVIESVDRGDDGFTVILASDDDLDTVRADAKRDLKARDWTILRAADMENRTMITGNKGERRLLMMIMGGDETRITLMGKPIE